MSPVWKAILIEYVAGAVILGLMIWYYLRTNRQFKEGEQRRNLEGHFQSLRSEVAGLRAEVAGLKTEIRKGTAGLREEIRSWGKK